MWLFTIDSPSTLNPLWTQWTRLSSQNIRSVNIHHLKPSCFSKRQARSRQRGRINMPDGVTAACQSVLKMFRLLQQRCLLANPDSCLSLHVSVVLRREVKGQGHAVTELHCHFTVYCLLSITAAQTGDQVPSISLLTYDICSQIFSTSVLTELDIYRWMKAAVQGCQAIVKGVIALLWSSLVFPFVFEHFGP